MADVRRTGSADGVTAVASAGFQATVSRITEASDAIERERRIPQKLIDAMVDQGLFRLLVPRSLGGGEVDYLDYLAMTQAIAAADGSAAWCFNQNNILGTMASLMPRPLAEEIWSDPRAILCNGPPQYAHVTPVDGGYSLTGRWNFSSGSPHSNWAIAISRVGDANTRTFAIPREQVTFLDSWQVNGLRGTGSFSFQVEDHFVPASRSYLEARTPNESGPLYRIPRGLFFGSGFASVALGVARSSLDAAIDVAVAKTPQEQALLRDQPAIQREIGQAEALWGSTAAYLAEKASRLWRSALDLDAIPMADRINLRLASTHAIRKAAEVVDIAYEVIGATSIFESSPIQRKFQDAHAITQQIQGRMEHYQTAGQFFLGMEVHGRLI